jgi:hypothetical protein
MLQLRRQSINSLTGVRCVGEEFSGPAHQTTCDLEETGVVKRGIVLRDIMYGFGLLAVDGKQYSFPSEGMWQSDVAPKVGMLVDVSFNSDGAPECIQAVSATQPAMHSLQDLPAGKESIDAPHNDRSNLERKHR